MNLLHLNITTKEPMAIQLYEQINDKANCGCMNKQREHPGSENIMSPAVKVTIKFVEIHRTDQTYKNIKNADTS